MNSVDIVIVHFGDLTITQNALESLESNVQYRFAIVVNNDPTISISQKMSAHPKRIYIDAEKNVGFAAGVNIGINHARRNNAEYIILFNNDAYVTSDFVSPLVTLFKDKKKVGIVSPVIQFEKNGKKVYDTGGTIQKYTGKTYHKNVDVLSRTSPTQVEYVSGCCMMIRAEVIDKIGDFDESFFLYYEDVDFCLRARKAGYDILCVPDVVVTHDLSKTVGANSSIALYHLIKSGNKFGKKYRTLFPLHLFFMVYQSMIFLIRSPFSLGAIVKGWV